MSKTALSITSLIVVLLSVTFIYYLWYLTLIHIHATDVMWFVYALSLPFVFIGTGLSKLLDWENKKNH
jgi:hypothetical protein